ncbi:MAG TPA: GHMP kinase [Vicinamibacteria bacterium]|nr:GHMP kinase [Vicinamibacteria bacterium]
MAAPERPLAVVNSVAPIRICDIGGWTDTWFAGHGQVFNLAVYPFAEAQVAIHAARVGAPRLMIHAENFAERYEVRHQAPPWGPHPLLEAAIAYMKVPRDLRLDVTIHSDAPPGAGTGTSAAVTVALIGALDALTPGRLTPDEVARAAQRVETEMLGRQCGIQDQIASAYGGINYIEMFDYPHASVSPVLVPDPIWWEFERRLVLVYLGRSHDSSAIHEEVIRTLQEAGPDSRAIADLRRHAPHARDALYAGDFQALGRSMIESTEAQGRLHSALIGAEARKVIEIAKAHGALGWKVNGAGGEGGSLTLLCGESSERKRALIREIEQSSEAFRSIPIYLSRHGLRVWRQDLG